MKHKFALLFAAVICFAGFVPTTSRAGLVIEVGDRAYYTHGPFYSEGGYRWVWVPGHWAWRHHHRFWIHGHYVRR